MQIGTEEYASPFGEMTDDIREIILADAERLGSVVIEQITQAFADVTLGNGISLHQAEALDDWCSDETVLAAARLLDTDERWQDVPDADIADHDGILHYMDAEGFRYYAPAYMIWSIKDSYSRISYPYEHYTLLYVLTLPDEEERRSRYWEKWALFDSAQCRAIADFLRFMASFGSGYGAGEALAKHWSQFRIPERAKAWAQTGEVQVRRTALVDQITRAFASIERGGGVSLHETGIIEIRGTEGERAAARLQDAEARWQDVPEADIQRYAWSLSFLDARGFRYYTPAYMVWTVQNIATSTSPANDAIVFYLNLPEAPIWKAHALEKWAYFTLEQCVAICAFLRFMADVSASMAQEDAPWIDPTPTQALTRYWGQFNDPDIDLPGDVWFALPAEVWLRHRISRQDRIDALVAQIAQAFDGVERGQGVSLHEANVIDDYGSDAERAEARRFDTDTRWQDVPEADIERYHWILSFLDAEGFRYYAPAYMVWTLRNVWTSDSSSTDYTVYAFKAYDNMSYSLDQWSLFSLEQRQAICGFLHFMAYESDGRADDVAAQEALASYWGQFGTE